MKKNIITAWPLLCLVTLWCIFSFPYFLQGKVPYASTYQVNNFAPWDAYAYLHGPVKNGAMPDVTTQIYPWKQFTIRSLFAGQIPLWNPNSFAGTPHLGNYQSAVLSPFNLLFFLFPFVDAWSILILLQPLLAGLFMYLYMRSQSVSKAAGLISSISFMFCGFITVWMDYGTLVYAILYLPLCLYCIEQYYKTEKKRYVALLSLAIGLSFLSGHFQISVYLYISVLFYQSALFVRKKRRQKALILLIFTVLGILFAMPQILPALESYSQSLRSTLFEKGEVIPWGYLPTFLIPDFFGNPVTRNDWYGHYAEWNGYVGVLPLLLGLYALKIKTKKVYFFFAWAIGAFLLAFFTPLLDLLIFFHIPVLATSAASRVIVLFSFCIIVLAGFGFDEVVKDIKKGTLKPVIIWVGISVLTVILLWVCVKSGRFLPADKNAIAKQNSIFPTLLFIVSSLTILFTMFFTKATLKNRMFFLSLVCIVLVSVDLLRFAIKWQAFDPKTKVFPDVPVTRFFHKISGYERVIGNFGGEAAVYYQLPSLEGYDAVYIRRYGEFIASLQNGLLQEADRSVVLFPKNGRYTSQAINLLNVKYIVHRTSDDFTPWTFPYWNYPGNQMKKIYDDSIYRIYQNSQAFPHAFFVSSVTIEKNPQKIIKTLFSPTFQLRNQIVLEENPGIFSGIQPHASSVIISRYTPNEIVLSVHALSEGMLFLSDPYYPGWEATIDGSKTKIYRADYAFRAIRMTPGTHTVSFLYVPVSFYIGVTSAFLSVISACGICLFSKRKTG